MFDELPLELQETIARQLNEPRLKSERRSGLRRFNKMFARLLYDGDWRTSKNGFIIVKGIMEECALGVRVGMKTETYARMYNRVYDVCTQKPPDNLTAELYSKFEAVARDFFADMNSEERRFFAKLLSHCFFYVNRFYVKRWNLPTTGELCERLGGGTPSPR